MAQLLVPPKAQFLDSNGDPLSGGKIYTYDAGTTTPRATYSDQGAGSPNANPVILDSNGQADIWLDSGNYKIRVDDANDVTLYTTDNIKSINDGSIVTAMLADSSVTTAKIADGAITQAKIQGGISSFRSTATKTDDYTITNADDVILVNAISKDITISYPPLADNDEKEITVVRIDDNDVKTDTFVDGDVTVGSDTINVGSHPFANLQRVQLTTSGTLPTGLSLATDYYVIYVDANNIKLADSIANAQSATAVDITAASGGGTHTITSQQNDVTLDGYLTQTLNNQTTLTLERQFQGFRCVGDLSTTNWVGTAISVRDPSKLEFGDAASGLSIEDNSGNMELNVNNSSGSLIVNLNNTQVGEFDSNGLTKSSLGSVTVSTDGSDPGVGGMGKRFINALSQTLDGTQRTVTNSSVTLTTTGRPVLLNLSYYGSYETGAGVAYINITTSTGAHVGFKRGSTNIRNAIGVDSSVNSGPGYTVIDTPAAGTHTYTIEYIKVGGSDGSISFTGYFTVIEL